MKILGKSIAAMSFLVASCVPASGHTQLRFEVPRPSLEIRVGHTPPPMLRSERRPPRPGADYVWLHGSWDLYGNDWAWVPGRWERPEHRDNQWVQARYTREGNAWRYEPSHWSNQRVYEGDAYREWRSKNDRNRGSGNSRDFDRD